MTNEPRRLLKAVIDTNILVSAVIVPLGNPNRLLTAWEQGLFTLIAAPQLIHEVDRVLHRARIQRKYDVTEDRVQDVIAKLHTTTLQTTPGSQLPLQSRDPKDDMFLAIALGGDADYLISGDEDLLILNGDPALGKLQIVTVRDFLALLSSSS